MLVLEMCFSKNYKVPLSNSPAEGPYFLWKWMNKNQRIILRWVQVMSLSSLGEGYLLQYKSIWSMILK